MSGGEIDRSELAAALASRRELGPDYDDAFVEVFAERIEQAVRDRVASVQSARDGRDRVATAAGGRQLALGIVSVALGVPISAIVLAVPEGTASLGALVVAWTGIVGVNLAHALQHRVRR